MVKGKPKCFSEYIIVSLKVEIAKRRGEQVPETWGVEKGGKLSTNPETILSGGGLFPLGGSEVTGEHLVSFLLLRNVSE